jgi:hypothetical protein
MSNLFSILLSFLLILKSIGFFSWSYFLLNEFTKIVFLSLVSSLYSLVVEESFILDNKLSFKN